MTDTNVIRPKQWVMIALSGALAASSYLIPLSEETPSPGPAPATGRADAPPVHASQSKPLVEPEPAIELAVAAPRPAAAPPPAPADFVDAAEPGADAQPSYPVIKISTILGSQDFLAEPAIDDSVRLLPVDQEDLIRPVSAVRR